MPPIDDSKDVFALAGSLELREGPTFSTALRSYVQTLFAVKALSQLSSAKWSYKPSLKKTDLVT
jgi:hypothetical protein